MAKPTGYRLADNLIPVQPALDFLPDRAIVSTKEQVITEYEDSENNKMEQKTYCIFSSGKQFVYTPSRIAKEGLFYSGKLDLPDNRWETADIIRFELCQSSKTSPEVFGEIKERFVWYMDFEDKRLYDLFSAFVIYTYFFPLFNTAPIIHLWGEFKTGKTKICTLLEAMAFNPVNSANMSAAVLYRTGQGRRAIIILDESEDLLTSEKSREIRNMLLAGTGKEGTVHRMDKAFGDDYTCAAFKVFSPKVIANIAGIDLSSIESRLIRILTEGTTSIEKKNRDPLVASPEWRPIRNDLYRLCLVKYKEVIEADKNLVDMPFSGRTLGIWKGILTIASLVGEDILQSILSFAIESASDMEEELDEKDHCKLLLRGLKSLTAEEGDKFYPNPYLADKLRKHTDADEFPWIGIQDLGHDMKRLGFKSESRYINSKQQRGYALDYKTVAHKESKR